MEAGFGPVQPFLDATTAAWRKAWRPGHCLVIDESMVYWQGSTSGHITFMPRKPTPLGFCMRTLACASSNVLLNAELCDSKEREALKRYVHLYLPHTAVTLRVLQPYHGTGREVIGDSYFASVSTAIALLAVGLFFIGNVKSCHKRFPKAIIKSHLKQRGDVMHMRVDIPKSPMTDVTSLFASGHMDKPPMVLVHTSGHGLAGDQRKRLWRSFDAKKGQYVKEKYTLDQPDVHARYRGTFSKVDIFNKMSLGPNSLQMVYKTKEWVNRFFLAVLSMCITNAYLAHV